MPTWEPDRREWTAIALGLAVAAAPAWFLFGLVGWLGVGLVGLIGLVITGRVALVAGRAVPDFDFGATGVGVVARQMEEERRAPPEQRAARWAEQEKTSAILYFVNTICIALARPRLHPVRAAPAVGAGRVQVHQQKPSCHFDR